MIYTMLSAQEARKRSARNTPTNKLVEKIMADITNACDDGKFSLVYWPEGENNYTIRHAAEALRRLGYCVTYDDDEVSLWIDWSEAK